MDLFDAIAEMRKDPSKIFQRISSTGSQWKLRWRKSMVEQQRDGCNWEIAALSTVDQTSEWTEVSSWKDVDYAEFMDWYCNPNNKRKKYQVKEKKLESVTTDINEQHVSPKFFHENCEKFYIPME